MAADELKRFGDRFTVLVVLGFSRGVLVHFHRDIFEREHGFNHGTDVFFLFVVAEQEAHDFVIGGGRLGHGLVSC